MDKNVFGSILKKLKTYKKKRSDHALFFYIPTIQLT